MLGHGARPWGILPAESIPREGLRDLRRELDPPTRQGAIGAPISAEDGEPTDKQRQIVERHRALVCRTQTSASSLCRSATGKPWLHSPRVGVGNSIGCHSIM